MPRRYCQALLSCYKDWRSHDCEGFTESEQGNGRAFTALLDAHADLEAGARGYLQRKMLSRKGGKLTVALFAKELNTVIMPAHANKVSALVNKDGVTSCASHTAALRCMVQLGLKCGALKRGLMQEHERKGVVKVLACVCVHTRART